MGFVQRYKIKSILQAVMWIVIGAGSTVLLVAAVKKNDEKKCTGININITGVSSHYFIDKKDVQDIIIKYASAQAAGKRIEEFDLRKMESALKNDIWIKDAEMYFDNNGVLQVDIDEREPLARLFTTGGSTFYIDSSLMMLPLSEKFSARLPVFTGFPSGAKILSKADSTLLKDVLGVSMLIQQDPFLMGMIDQVDITASRTFEMIPKIGDQLIVFGDAADGEEKFRKLKLFYKNVLVKNGWSRYSVINLQYKGQVVGKIRGADDVTEDSLRTIQLMQLIAENTEKMASDSMKAFPTDSEKNNSDSTMVQQSIQRDEAGTDDMPELTSLPVKPITKPAVQPDAKIKSAAMPGSVMKPAVKLKINKAVNDRKPKAIMQKPAVKNDY